MNNFWQNLVGEDFSSTKQHLNISNTSSEALTDALEDDSESVPDEIPDDQGGDTTDDQNQGGDPGMGGDFGMDDGSGGDTGGSDDMSGGGDMGGTDDFGSDSSDDSTSEPATIEKDKFSLLNGKIELVERFDVLISHATSVKEMLEVNTTVNKDRIEELEELIKIMSDLKVKVGIKSQAESLIRYRMCYMRLKNILNSCLEKKVK